MDNRRVIGLGGTILNSEEICKILEASKGTGIKEIKLKDITLKFDNLTDQDTYHNNGTKTVLSNVMRPIDDINEIDTVGDTNIYGEVEKTEKQEELADEFVMAHLMANDPEAYENYQKER
jgi:hypothetical protein